MGKKKRICRLFIGLVGLVLVGFAVVAVEFILMRGDTPKIGGIQNVASLEKIDAGRATPSTRLLRGDP